MKVKSISEYIGQITNIIENKSDDIIIAYRGETEYYRTHCQPNLFRNDHIIKKPFFEKNLFDEMAANKLTSSTSYLEKAIDAQHGGFPSRLLDVTYNCLVALYFATTPNITYAEDVKDGVVYIFAIDKIFCPSGENINLVYDSIINRDCDKRWLWNESIFQKNHKLIDHIKSNKRIIAQQGAFILFQGDRISPIQKSDYKKVKIDKDSKSQIRKDLKKLFGIHTGTIYPEPTNLVDDIIKKSYFINGQEFNISTELDLVLSNLNRELQYYLDSLVKMSHNEHKNKVQKITSLIVEVEEVTYSYKNSFEQLKRSKDKYLYVEANIEEVITDYNNLIKEFHESIEYYINVLGIEFNHNELVIRGI